MDDDEHYEVYYQESVLGDENWTPATKMLHAPDDFDRIHVNAVQDEGSIWLGALKNNSNANRWDVTHIGIWYREVGDEFTTEIDLVGFGRHQGLTMAITSEGSKRMLFLSSNAEKDFENHTGYFNVIFRQEVERAFGNAWSWQKDVISRTKRPIVISKWFAFLFKFLSSFLFIVLVCLFENRGFLGMLYIDDSNRLHAREYRDGSWHEIGILTRWSAAKPPSYSLMATNKTEGRFTITITGPTGGNPSHIQMIFITPVDGDWSQTTAVQQIDPANGSVDDVPTVSSANGVYAVVYRGNDETIFSTICDNNNNPSSSSSSSPSPSPSAVSEDEL